MFVKWCGSQDCTSPGNGIISGFGDVGNDRKIKLKYEYKSKEDGCAFLNCAKKISFSKIEKNQSTTLSREIANIKR